MKWPIRNLIDITESLHQGLNTAGEKIKFVSEGYPIIQTRNISNSVIDIDHKIKYMSQLDWDKYSEKYRPKIGDVFFTNIGTIGKTAVVHEEMDYLIHWNIFKIRPLSDAILPSFLKLHLDFLTDTGFFQKSQKGGTVSFVTKKTMAKIEIPLPPLETQKQIAAKLDQAFTDIEKAKANAEQNLKNAKELFDNYLSGVFSKKSDEWVNTFLGQIAQFKNGLNFSQNSKGKEVKIVGVRDFKSFFWVPFEQLETIRTDSELDSSYELKKDDIITVRSNGNKRLIGRCLLVGDVKSKTSYSGFTIRIRIISPDLDPKFLAFYLKSPSVHELLISSGSGANISNLNQKILSSLPVTYPDSLLQNKIVINIEKIELESKKLVEIYQAKIDALVELKQSILQKAFNGELA